MDPLARHPALCLHTGHWEQMRREVELHIPEEACGLLAGYAGCSMAVYPVENSLHSPVRFRMEPRQQVKAIFEIEARGWGLYAIFHSHPAGPPHPSLTDIAEAAYPGAAYLIWSPLQDGWYCRGFSIENRQVIEVPVMLVDK